jgi:hypothetical protein
MTLPKINPALPKPLQKAYGNFLSNRKNWIEVQENILLRILRQNANSAYGLKMDFAGISNSQQFGERIPVMEWSDMEKAMSGKRVGDPIPFLSEPISHIVPTSGTTGANKRIPYTDSFLKEYREGLLVWIADLYTRFPALNELKSFWSISPHLAKRKGEDEFPDDLFYFGEIAPWIAQTLAVGSDLTQISDFDDFMESLMTHLVCTRDLGFISVWHPSYLFNMTRLVLNKKERILHRLFDEDGKDHRAPFALEIRQESREILLSEDDPAKLFQQLWPQMQLISCWTDGQSESYVSRIAELFPSIKIQAKGLLATEGLFTLPLDQAGGPVPAFTSHFLEFLDEKDVLVPKKELETGRVYSLLLTASNGLYRYRIGDRVGIEDFYEELPVLRFVGRDQTLDLCGEKITYDFVLEKLKELFVSHQMTPSFYLFAPLSGRKLGYQLFIECSSKVPENLGKELDDMLRQNLYYDHALRAGQLQPTVIKEVDQAMMKYRNYHLSQGRLLGNLKYRNIDTGRDWEEVFNG